MELTVMIPEWVVSVGSGWWIVAATILWYVVASCVIRKYRKELDLYRELWVLGLVVLIFSPVWLILWCIYRPFKFLGDWLTEDVT